MSEEDVIADLVRRDEMDSTRALNPLRRAEDAVLLDSSDLTIAEVASRIIDLWKEKTAHVI